jgi:hypothetical protein
MATYLLGLFLNKSTAASAQQQLVEIGFPNVDLALAEQPADEINGDEPLPVTPQTDPVGVGSFVNSLVGSQEEEVSQQSAGKDSTNSPYSRLTVQLPTDTDLMLAKELLSQFGAVEVYERTNLAS